MQKLVWQNSNGDVIDLTSGNYGITEWEGFSNTDLNIQSQQVPFQDGGVFLDALIEQRELSVTLAMCDGGNLETRYRLRRELIHALNPKLGEGYLIYTNDFISKRIKCVAQIPLFETHNSNDSGTPKASLAWTACDPYWEDLNDTVVFLQKGESAIIKNDGDKPCEVTMELNLLSESTINPSIKNMTNNKKIELGGTFTNDIFVDTNVGKKNIFSQIKNIETLNVSYSPIYFNGMLLGVSSVVYESGIDKINWKYRNRLTSIVQGSGVKKILKVGNVYYILYATLGNSLIFTTEDFETYTEHNTGFSCYDFIYDGSKFILVGANKIGYGTDVDNITIINLDSSYYLNSVIYSQELGLYCAVGNIHTSPYHQPLVYKSSDGINWSKVTDTSIPTATNRDLEATKIVYGNGLFVVIFNMPVIIKSVDCDTWVTTIDYRQSTGVYSFKDIMFQKNLFITVGNNSDDVSDNNYYIMTSGDGFSNYEKIINTRLERGSEISDDIHFDYVAEVGKIFLYVYIAYKQKYLLSFTLSSTTATLENMTYPIRLNNKYSGIYVNGEYIFTTYSGDSSDCILKSKNLVNWETILLGHFKTICYVKKYNMYVAIENYGTSNDFTIYKSQNLEDWETLPFTAGSPNSVFYDEVHELCVIFGRNGLIMTSEDLENWNVKDSGSSANLVDMAVRSDGVVCFVGDKDIITTTDYEAFSKQEIQTTVNNQRLISISCNKNIFVAIFVFGGEIVKSYDGYNFIKFVNNLQSSTSLQYFITYDIYKNIFVMLVEDNTNYVLSVIYSQDGSVWYRDTSFNDKIGNGPTASVVLVSCFIFVDKYVIVNGSAIYQNSAVTNINIIDKLTQDSNIGFNLEIGNNNLLSDVNTTLRFRQKYIGV